MTRTANPSPADPVRPEQTARFAAALGRLHAGESRLGLAVSGGPDSLAMLLLAQSAIPGGFEVATVDHGLRPEAADEAAFVADVCRDRGIPHEILEVQVPDGNLQDAARTARYAALRDWAAERHLAAIATAHHADDQAETLVMRLNRGSGLAGLAGVRQRGTVPGSGLPLVRPLLDWRRHELGEIVARSGLVAASDPSNVDPRYDRARLRAAMAGAEWLDPAAVARSASHLADADEALDWAAERLWDESVRVAERAVHYEPGAPRAITLRVVARIIAHFGGMVRGSEIARLVDALEGGRGGTLGGVMARVERGAWVFRAEPPRRT